MMAKSSLLVFYTLLGLLWISQAYADTPLYSTRKPGDNDYNEDADGEVDVEDDAGDENELDIVVLKVSPYVIERDGESELLEGEFKGFIPDLLSELCKGGYMSCEYTLLLPADGTFGSRDVSGTWTGAIGEVKREEVDFAAAPLTITDERKTVVDFSEPWMDISTTVIVNTADNIDSLDSLMNSDIVYGGIDGGSVLSSLRTHPEAPYSEMWSAIQSNPNSTVSSYDEGVQKVLKGKYALIMETDLAEYYINRHCSIARITEDFLPGKGYGIAFPKESQYIDDINKGIRALKEDGTMKEIHDKWFDATCGAASLSAVTSLLSLALALVFVIM